LYCTNAVTTNGKMKSSHLRVYKLLILAACCARIDIANGAAKEEEERDCLHRQQMHEKPRSSRRIRSETNVRYQYDNFFYRGSGSGGNAREFFIKQFDNKDTSLPEPTAAPVIRDTLYVKPVSPDYFYKPLVLFPGRNTSPPTKAPTPEPPTKAPPRRKRNRCLR